MKRIIYLLLISLPFTGFAQNSEEEKITKVQITIEKDGETKTITRELKDSDYESEVRVLRMDLDGLTEDQLAEAKVLMEHNKFFVNGEKGEEKEVAFLGVTGHSQAMGADEVVMLDKIVEGEAASKAGLMPGDIIRSMNGEDLGSWHALVEMIHASQPGEEVSLKVDRAGKTKVYKLVLGSKMTSSTGMMRLNYDVIKGNPNVQNMRFVFSSELSEKEAAILSEQTGLQAKDLSALKNVNLEMFPNPTEGEFNFELKLDEGGTLDVIVYDASGSQIAKQSQKSNNGEYKGSFDLSDNPAGNYMIVFEKDGKAVVEKVLKI